jgi:hypothetical protein
MFAVVKIMQEYEYVEDVKCIFSSLSQQECIDYINKLREERLFAVKDRQDYCSKFVDDLEVPELDSNAWIEYLKTFFGDSKYLCYISRQDFKSKLKGILFTTTKKIKDFNPPPKPSDISFNLFVVEIPEN